ncbi:MAG: hypothetical protein CALGDGBN_01423 [Pseudomonadales bacterium]|nr:hypothetical protein [Pseudomonadales bacterium]
MKQPVDDTAAIRLLLDIEAVKQLKHSYCRHVDAGDWDALERLWTEDARCDYGFFGCYEGRSGIMDGFFRTLVGPATSFNAHMVHNPIVEIEGDTARGSWYMTAQTVIQPHNQAVWAMGVYEDVFRRVDGEWRIASLQVGFRYYTPYEEGWAKTPMWQIPA